MADDYVMYQNYHPGESMIRKVLYVVPLSTTCGIYYGIRWWRSGPYD